MNIRSITRALLSVAALLVICTSVANAGGWAVITLDDYPTQVTAGETLTLGFMVRQHGRTLRDDVRPLLHFARADINESFTVTAAREGPSGHYSAVVTFPAAGQWNWRVDVEQFGMVTQDMPAINVSAATASQAAPTSTLPVAAGLVGLIGMGAGLFLWWRSRQWWALALTGVAIAIGLGGLIAMNSNTALATASAQPDRIEPADRGKILFAAKGCVMCHTTAALNASEGPFTFGDKAAPNLTQVTLSDEYLRQWLKNPAAFKPGTYMPNLNLKADEIEALIAFLKSE